MIKEAAGKGGFLSISNGRRNMLMAMQIDTNYDHFRTDYSERVKEKQAAERAEEAKGTEAQRAGKSSQPQDEYISSEKSEQKPSDR